MKTLNFFQSDHSPYYIFGLDYRQSSAGVRALHYLCHALNELGEEAYISTAVSNPYLRAPTLTRDVIGRHAQSKRTPIAIYPEVVPGNPFEAKIVARWILNKPGHIGGDYYYDKGELLFVYQRTYTPDGMATNPLFIPTVDERIFNNRDNPFDSCREGACYYAHKYLVFGGQLDRRIEGAASLCQDIERSHEEIASILRRSEVLYSYEPSAIVSEALYCGCPVLLQPSDYLATNYDYTLLRGPGVEIGFGPDALSKAKQTLKDLDVTSHIAWGETTLRRFVQITQRVAKERISRQVSGTQHGSVVEVLHETSPYAIWRHTHMLALEKSEAPSFLPNSIWFHIVIPFMKGDIAALEETLVSIAGQSYRNFRISILSSQPAPEGFVSNDAIAWVRSDHGIGEGLNQQCQKQDEWLLPVEPGDSLEARALHTVAQHIEHHPEWHLAFFDEDSVAAGGVLEKPFFKPDYSIDLHRAAPYVLSAGLAVRCALFAQVSESFTLLYAIDFYDLLLRLHEKLGIVGIGHIPDVLYHRNVRSWQMRALPENSGEKRNEALRSHLERINRAADISEGKLPGTFRIHYHHNDSNAVSIIVPTQNGGTYLQRCIGAIVENTDYRNLEILIIDQGSDDQDTLGFLKELRAMDNEALQVISMPRETSLPALINAGARQASGNYLLFMSDATAPLERDWLGEMLGYATQPDVGVVGAKTIGSDGMISSSGYILGLDGRPAGQHDLHRPNDDLGYFGMLQVPNNPSAVSATCMLTEKALFEQLGGFDEQELAGGYSDVDYCLKVWQAGRRVVWTPYAVLLQEHMRPPPDEEASDELAFGGTKARSWHTPTQAERVMFARWGKRIAFDPAYNRNLSLMGGAYEIEIAPALTWDPEVRPVPRILAHPADQEGCGEYRIKAPMRALIASGKIQGWETGYYLTVPELMRMSPDSIVLQRQITDRQIAMMEEYFDFSDAFRIFELDDLMTNIQLQNQARKNFLAKDLVKRFRYALDRCDRFVVSTDALAEEYRKYKREIVVVPNTIERAIWEDLNPMRRQGRKPRVGWVGSPTHTGDLAIIADVVKALKDEVEWVFFGLCPEGVRPLVEYHAFVPIDQYPAKMASLNLDLALAPLEDVPFNHAKSHLRLLEYGMLGYPVVCSDITPYRGDFPVVRVRNRYKDWVNAIREQLTDMDALAQQGDTLRTHIRAHWLLEENLDRWLAAWLP